jgi:hypothetical protein
VKRTTVGQSAQALPAQFPDVAAIQARCRRRAGADWLKAAYAEVFSFVDPMQDDETRIRDAFRGPLGIVDWQRAAAAARSRGGGVQPMRIKVSVG